MEVYDVEYCLGQLLAMGESDGNSSLDEMLIQARESFLGL